MESKGGTNADTLTAQYDLKDTRNERRGIHQVRKIVQGQNLEESMNLYNILSWYITVDFQPFCSFVLHVEIYSHQINY